MVEILNPDRPEAAEFDPPDDTAFTTGAQFNSHEADTIMQDHFDIASDHDGPGLHANMASKIAGRNVMHDFDSIENTMTPLEERPARSVEEKAIWDKYNTNYVHPTDSSYGSVFPQECEAKFALKERIIVKLPEHENETPCRPPMRIPPDHQRELYKQLKYYLDKGWITPSNSPYGAPVFFVPKKNGKLRMCIDYRMLNKITKKDKFSLPDSEQLMAQLSGATHFSCLDLAHGYHQCILHDDDREKTAFRSLFGSYQWNVMCFGLTNAVPAFIKTMESVLRKHLGVRCVCFVDDILIYSKGDKKQHMADVCAVLDSIAEHKSYVNWAKSEFLSEYVEYMGFRIYANGMIPLEDKVAAIGDAPIPTTVYGVRSFLGAVGFYRKFIYKFSEIARPLTDLTKDNEEREKVKTSMTTMTKFGRDVSTASIVDEWTDVHTHAFESLKKAITSYPVLKLPDSSKDYEVMVDGSKIAVGAVLMQRDDNNDLHPIAFYSHKLTDAESRYSPFEFELLAIFKALKHWRYLLIGNKCIIYTDHKPLTFMQTQEQLTDRQSRCITYLADFDTDIVAVKGTANVVADHLSRYPANISKTLTTLCDDLRKKHPDISNCQDTVITAHGFNYLGTPSEDPTHMYPTGMYKMYATQNHYVTKKSLYGAYFSTLSPFQRGEGQPKYFRFSVDTSQAKGSIPKRSDKEIHIPHFAYSSNTSSDMEDELVLKLDDCNDSAGFYNNLPCHDEDIKTDDKLNSIKAAITLAYEGDKLATEVLTGSPHAPEYMFVRDSIVLYNDRDNRERIYIPASAQATPKYVTTEHPIEGEDLRIKCTLREELLREAHEQIAHLGAGKTLKHLQQYYYWPRMQYHVQDYVRGCRTCQRNKASNSKPYGKLRPLQIPSSRWEYISLDWITHLPRTKSGYDAILVVVDSFSKRAHFIKAKTTDSSKDFATRFFHEVYKHHGMPLKIVSDRDVKLTGGFWTTLSKALGTNLAMSTPYHPQTDGQTERVNRVIGDMLRWYTHNGTSDWDIHLTAAEFAYNNTVHSSTGYTPFMLDTGREPLNPLSISAAQLFSTLEDGVDPNYDTVKDYLEDWYDNLDLARASLQASQDDMTDFYNSKRNLHKFKKGDLVFLDTEDLSFVDSKTGFVRSRKKLDERYSGPYKILEVYGAGKLNHGLACKLDLTDSQMFHKVQSVAKLKPCKESTIYSDAHQEIPPATVFPEDSLDPEDEEFEVDIIVAHRGPLNDRRRYRVQWKGYPSSYNKWVDRKELLRHAVDTVDEYEDSLKALQSGTGIRETRSSERLRAKAFQP